MGRVPIQAWLQRTPKGVQLMLFNTAAHLTQRKMSRQRKLVQLDELQEFIPPLPNHNPDMVSPSKAPKRIFRQTNNHLFTNETKHPSLEENLSEASAEMHAFKLKEEKPCSFGELKVPLWLQTALSARNINQPTALQTRIINLMGQSLNIQPNNNNNNANKNLQKTLLIRAQTGTGKSMGFIVALLSRLHQAKLISSSTKNGLGASHYSCRTLLLVPNVILGLQLLRWIYSLLKCDEYWQTRLLDIVRIALPESAQEVASSLLDAEIPSEIATPGPSLLLIATAGRLNELLAQDEWQWQHLREIVIDEIDSQLKPLSAYATDRERRSRRQHPQPAEVLLWQLRTLYSNNNANGKLVDKVDTNMHAMKTFPRLIAASATLNERCRRALARITGNRPYNLIQDCKVEEAPLTCPPSIHHHYRMLRDAESVDELAQLVGDLVKQRHHGETGVLFVPSTKSKAALQQLLKRCAGISPILLSQVRYGPTDVDLRGQLLIGSDLDARGWDLPMLSYVLIVDLPESPAHYVHMAGRVGRLGSRGDCVVYSFVAGKKDLERLYGIYSMLRIKATPYSTINITNQE